MLEKVRNAYMRRLMSILFAALCFQTFLIGSYTCILHGTTHVHLATFMWKLYKLVHLFVNLSLCYPIIVFTNKPIKLHLIFLLFSNIISGGTIQDCAKSSPGSPSGYNDIDFMFIFSFTLYENYQLKSHMYHDSDDQGYIKGLKSLIDVEMALIFLNSLPLILFFSGTNDLLQSLRLSITLVQYLKIYMIMSLFASLNVTVKQSHRT
jgi:hypothetical protein